MCVGDFEPKIGIKKDKMQWTLVWKWIVYEPRCVFCAFEVNVSIFQLWNVIVTEKKCTHVLVRLHTCNPKETHMLADLALFIDMRPSHQIILMRKPQRIFLGRDMLCLQIKCFRW